MKGGKRTGAGRPAGSKTRATIEIRAAAREYTSDALEVLAGIMCDSTAPAAARISAACAILDRGYGKAAQSVAVEQSGAIDNYITIRWE